MSLHPIPTPRRHLGPRSKTLPSASHTATHASTLPSLVNSALPHRRILADGGRLRRQPSIGSGVFFFLFEQTIGKWVTFFFFEEFGKWVTDLTGPRFTSYVHTAQIHHKYDRRKPAKLRFFVFGPAPGLSSLGMGLFFFPRIRSNSATPQKRVQIPPNLYLEIDAVFKV